jgi:hypothetical protein
MAEIIFPRVIKKGEYLNFVKLWDENNNVSLVMPEKLSENEIRDLFAFLFSDLPNEFAFSVLSNLAEMKNTPMDLLEALFDRGDTGCNVTICLRSDLSGNLIERCQSSLDPEVREHFSLARK